MSAALDRGPPGPDRSIRPPVAGGDSAGSGAPERRKSRRGYWPLVALGLGLLALGLGPVLAGLVPDTGLPAPVQMPFLVLVGLFFIAEIFVIDVELRREVHSISLSEVPLVLGLFFVAPVVLIVARLAGSGGGLLLHARQLGIKLYVNLASFFAETVVAIAVFSVIVRGHDPIGPWGWLAAMAAVLAADAVAAMTVTLAVRLSQGHRVQDSWWPVLAGAIAALANTALALVAVLVMWYEVAAVVLLGVVAVVVFFAYRGYASLRQRYQSLQTLHGFTKVVGRSLEIDSVMSSVLFEARELTRCERSELMLLERPSGEPGIRAVDDERAGHAVSPLTPEDATDLLWAKLVADDSGFIATPESSDVRLRAQLEARRMRSAMAAPLHSDRGIVGMLLVANRLTEHATFDAEDLKMFETLANHASVSLENGRLVDELRQEAAEKEHQSLHDALTGLPNRSYFLRAVRRALTPERSTELTAIMLMDLDHFKEINDTLGHHDGDEVLRVIATRLLASVRDDDVIARLGGDEFAIMMSDVQDHATALDRARELHAAACQTLTVHEIQLAVGASIGIAIAPEHGTDAMQLLQHADVAMYHAKAEHSGCEIYTVESDGHSRSRLALAGDLHRAIEEREFVLHYQPKADLRTKAITGVEALIRWQHPERGLLFPDSFIPIVEHVGMISPITSYVLREAVRARGDWLDDGFALDLSVNVTARDLLDDRLAEEVEHLITKHGLPPGALTLEITESQIMAEATRVAPMLERLSGLGAKLSIDDFGTGYSSLSSLRELPIDEIKIDKSFVLGMCDDENDGIIVRSTADLGHNLGLRVVAEGVEDEMTWSALETIACDGVQGYYLSRPVPDAALLEWLRERLASVSRDHDVVTASTTKNHGLATLNR